MEVFREEGMQCAAIHGRGMGGGGGSSESIRRRGIGGL